MLVNYVNIWTASWKMWWNSVSNGPFSVFNGPLSLWNRPFSVWNRPSSETISCWSGTIRRLEPSAVCLEPSVLYVEPSIVRNHPSSVRNHPSSGTVRCLAGPVHHLSGTFSSAYPDGNSRSCSRSSVSHHGRSGGAVAAPSSRQLTLRRPVHRQQPIRLRNTLALWTESLGFPVQHLSLILFVLSVIATFLFLLLLLLLPLLFLIDVLIPLSTTNSRQCL